MSRLTKCLLELTIANSVLAALFLSDTVDVSNVPGLYATFPFAVILLGLCLISRALEK